MFLSPNLTLSCTRWSFLSRAIMTVGLLLTSVATYSDSTNENWQSGFDYQPFNGRIDVTITDIKGNRYFGGDFTNVGGVKNTAHIVMWEFESETFVPLGNGLETGFSRAEVYALALDDNGNLYIGGDFQQCCGDVDCG